MTRTRRNAGLLFFGGSLLLNPIGYLAGTSLGALVARSALDGSSTEMSTNPTAMWLVFGGGSVAISTLNLVLFLCLISRSSSVRPPSTHPPTVASSVASG